MFRETTPLVRAGTRPGLSQGREGPGPAPGSQLGLERSLSLSLVRDVLGSELGPGQGRGLILGQGRGRGWGLGEDRDVAGCGSELLGQAHPGWPKLGLAGTGLALAVSWLCFWMGTMPWCPVAPFRHLCGGPFFQALRSHNVRYL